MSLKKNFLDKSLNFIKENNDDINEDQIAIALYGLEVIYSGLTQLIIFMIISLILGVVAEFFLVFCFLALARMTSFGFHAESEISCFITSFAITFGTIYISTYIDFNVAIKIILCLTSIIITFLYAPADTEKRPLYNVKTRSRLKKLSICLVIVYSIICLLNIGFISNVALCILVVNSINISPILYKLFNRRYRNYDTI